MEHSEPMYSWVVTWAIEGIPVEDIDISGVEVLMPASIRPGQRSVQRSLTHGAVPCYIYHSTFLIADSDRYLM
jgi:hypothetical protein